MAVVHFDGRDFSRWATLDCRRRGAETLLRQEFLAGRFVPFEKIGVTTLAYLKGLSLMPPGLNGTKDLLFLHPHTRRNSEFPETGVL